MATEPVSCMLNEDAIRYLLAHADDDESSTSDYWQEHKQWFGVREDGICEWSQHYYTARPPFLHKRPYGDKVVLHRFVELEKDHA